MTKYAVFTLEEMDTPRMRAGIDPDATTWTEATLRRAEEVLNALERKVLASKGEKLEAILRGK